MVVGCVHSVKITTFMVELSATDAKRSRPSKISMVSQNIFSRRMKGVQIWLSNRILCLQLLWFAVIVESSSNILKSMVNISNSRILKTCLQISHLSSVTKKTTSICRILSLIKILFWVHSSNLSRFLWIRTKEEITSIPPQVRTTMIYNNSSKLRSLWLREWEIGCVPHAKTSTFRSEKSATGASRTDSKIFSNPILNLRILRCHLALMVCRSPTSTCRICSSHNPKFSSIILPSFQTNVNSSSVSNQFSSLVFKISPISSPQPKLSCHLSTTAESIMLGAASEWE